jgi:Fanconi-associated nuclease 1
VLISVSNQCIGDESLAIICQLFCEDYRGRSSGGPDLFVWNAELQSCKFVEVKGPGDIARENQKFWFDSLLCANIDVEVCYVIDKNAKPSTSSKKRKAKTPSSSQKKANKHTPVKHEALSEEDYDQLDMTPEDSVEDPSPLTLTPKKRRRITDPEYRHLEENQELPSPSEPYYNKAPLYLKHTSPVRHRMEVLITSPSRLQSPRGS